MLDDSAGGGERVVVKSPGGAIRVEVSSTTGGVNVFYDGSEEPLVRVLDRIGLGSCINHMHTVAETPFPRLASPRISSAAVKCQHCVSCKSNAGILGEVFWPCRWPTCGRVSTGRRRTTTAAVQTAPAMRRGAADFCAALIGVTFTVGQ